MFPGSQISFRFTGVDFGNAYGNSHTHFIIRSWYTHIHMLYIYTYIYSICSIDFLFSFVRYRRVWNFDSHPIFSCARSSDDICYEKKKKKTLMYVYYVYLSGGEKIYTFRSFVYTWQVFCALQLMYIIVTLLYYYIVHKRCFMSIFLVEQRLNQIWTTYILHPVCNTSQHNVPPKKKWLVL